MKGLFAKINFVINFFYRQYLLQHIQFFIICGVLVFGAGLLPSILVYVDIMRALNSGNGCTFENICSSLLRYISLFTSIIFYCNYYFLDTFVQDVLKRKNREFSLIPFSKHLRTFGYFLFALVPTYIGAVISFFIFRFSIFLFLYHYSFGGFYFNFYGCLFSLVVLFFICLFVTALNFFIALIPIPKQIFRNILVMLIEALIFVIGLFLWPLKTSSSVLYQYQLFLRPLFCCYYLCIFSLIPDIYSFIASLPFIDCYLSAFISVISGSLILIGLIFLINVLAPIIKNKISTHLHKATIDKWRQTEKLNH